MKNVYNRKKKACPKCKALAYEEDNTCRNCDYTFSTETSQTTQLKEVKSSLKE